MQTEKNTSLQFGILTALILIIIEQVTDYNLESWTLAALIVALIAPQLYDLPARCWLQGSKLLGRLFSYLLLLIVYVILVVPMGLLRRQLGHNPLHLRDFGRSEGSVFSNIDKRYAASDLKQQF